MVRFSKTIMIHSGSDWRKFAITLFSTILNDFIIPKEHAKTFNELTFGMLCRNYNEKYNQKNMTNEITSDPYYNPFEYVSQYNYKSNNKYTYPQFGESVCDDEHSINIPNRIYAANLLDDATVIFYEELACDIPMKITKDIIDINANFPHKDEVNALLIKYIEQRNKVIKLLDSINTNSYNALDHINKVIAILNANTLLTNAFCDHINALSKTLTTKFVNASSEIDNLRNICMELKPYANYNLLSLDNKTILEQILDMHNKCLGIVPTIVKSTGYFTELIIGIDNAYDEVNIDNMNKIKRVIDEYQSIIRQFDNFEVKLLKVNGVNYVSTTRNLVIRNLDSDYYISSDDSDINTSFEYVSTLYDTVLEKLNDIQRNNPNARLVPPNVIKFSCYEIKDGLNALNDTKDGVASWCALFNTKFVQDNHICAAPGLQTGEDVSFYKSLTAVLKDKHLDDTYVICDTPIYIWINPTDADGIGMVSNHVDYYNMRACKVDPTKTTFANAEVRGIDTIERYNNQPKHINMIKNYMIKDKTNADVSTDKVVNGHYMSPYEVRIVQLENLKTNTITDKTMTLSDIVTKPYTRFSIDGIKSASDAAKHNTNIRSEKFGTLHGGYTIIKLCAIWMILMTIISIILFIAVKHNAKLFVQRLQLTYDS